MKPILIGFFLSLTFANSAQAGNKLPEIEVDNTENQRRYSQQIAANPTDTAQAISGPMGTHWSDWLVSQIEKHPDVVAAREQWLGSNANAENLEQPIYNPQLLTGFERNGEDDNYRIGISQAIDLWDRQGVRKQQASYLRTAAKSLYQQKVLNKTSDALTVLVEWYAANRAASITQTQQQQLNTLLELVEKRQQVGDLGGIDAELTFLSLAQQLAQVAQVEAALQKTEAKVRELLPNWSPERGGVPDSFWPSAPDSVTNRELLAHPAVANAYGRWRSLKEKAEITRRAAKADPTIGVMAGEEGGDSLAGLTFSMPLNVRNNFSARTRAAERVALEAEARFQAILRKQRFDCQAAYTAWQRFEKQNHRWQALVRGRIGNSAKLLKQQWHSGDLSTTDYLLALNQRAKSLRSGIKLEKQTRLALTEVLQKSGRLVRMTMSETVPTNK